MSCMWGGTPPWWSILLLNNDYCSSEWSKDWLNRFKTQRKTESHSTKVHPPLVKVWASWRPHVHGFLCCPWAAAGLHIIAFYRGAGRWWRWQLGELVTGSRSQVVFTETSEQNRACQAAQYLPCNMKPYCSIHAFSVTALRVELTSAKKSLLKILIQIYMYTPATYGEVRSWWGTDVITIRFTNI